MILTAIAGVLRDCLLMYDGKTAYIICTDKQHKALRPHHGPATSATWCYYRTDALDMIFTSDKGGGTFLLMFVCLSVC